MSLNWSAHTVLPTWTIINFVLGNILLSVVKIKPGPATIHKRGGFKWDINYDWSINIELSYRSLWTDYLDDVSTVFPDIDNLESQRGATAASLSNRALVDGIAEEGRQRGDSTRNDQYVFVGVGVMKYFGRLECPKISDVR